MIPEYVRGPIAPVFTAFHEDGRFDPEGQRAFLDFLHQSGAISAYFVRSGMGQMYAFDYDDVKQMADTACGHLRDKAPVLVGATGIWDRNLDRRPDPKTFLEQAIELSKYAEGAGAAGVVHTLPEAIEPGPGETHADVILRYFEAIDRAVSVPIFIYQPPGTLPEYRVTVELAQRLADIPHVMGMKASTPDAAYILDITWATRDKDFGYIVGHEGAYYAGLHMGAHAVIGQGCCVNPQIVVAVEDRFRANDMIGAMDAQRSVNLLCEKSEKTQEFLKRYAAEQGFAVKPYGRSMKYNPYGGNVDETPLTREQYESYKALLESELAKYVEVPA